jgi:hypothetical protein
MPLKLDSIVEVDRELRNKEARDALFILVVKMTLFFAFTFSLLGSVILAGLLISVFTGVKFFP